MTTWIIEPRDPLIVRDGRPFGPTPGARATTLPFPFPSTTTGGVRSHAGKDAAGIFDRSRIADVKRIAIRGPLLVELDASGDISCWYAPAPADALLFADVGGSPQIKRLLPLALPANSQTDLDTDLAIVGLAQPDPRKPADRPPRFWSWPSMVRWLLDPPDDWMPDDSWLAIGGPAGEQRMHVSIRTETQTGHPGALFQTRGLEFTGHTWSSPAPETHSWSELRRLALAVTAESAFPHFAGGLAPLGGERRLAYWRQSATSLPECPPEILATVLRDRACRVILLTPAHFVAGWRPQWLTAPHHGAHPVLRAAAIQRPQVVSGWDYEHRRPKPARRLAPAGSVLFLSFQSQDDEAAIAAWVRAIWMQCVSDDTPDGGDQDRRDGFGLAVIGSWDGKSRPMQV